MTEEELARFALQLRETERIRAMIAEEAAALANGRTDVIPIAAAPAEGQWSPVAATGSTVYSTFHAS
jgi:hypothetical protein